MDTEEVFNRVSVLSDKFCKKVPAPVASAQLDYFDADLKGLMLRVFRSGKKTWYFRWWAQGKKRAERLGHYPAMDRRRALAAAERLKAGRVLGTDPAVAREAQKGAETFADLADEYLARHAVNKKSYADDLRILKHDLLPYLGKLKAAEITRRDVIKTLDLIYDRGAKVQCNRTATLLNTIFKVGVAREVVKSNPCDGATKHPGGVEKARVRVLFEPEIKAAWGACEGLYLGDAARLLLLTGARVSEVMDLEWRELDLIKGTWLLPAERSKNKKPHSVPLVGQALEILRRLEAAEHRDPIRVFPGVTKGTIATLKRHLRKATGSFDWYLHDLRRTVATNLIEIGVREIVVSKLLNHSARGVTGVVYIQHPYDQEKRAALAAWGRRLDEIVTGRAAAKVIELFA